MSCWCPMFWINFFNFYTSCHIKKKKWKINSKTYESILSNEKSLKYMHTIIFHLQALAETSLFMKMLPLFCYLTIFFFFYVLAGQRLPSLPNPQNKHIDPSLYWLSHDYYIVLIFFSKNLSLILLYYSLYSNCFSASLWPTLAWW